MIDEPVRVPRVLLKAPLAPFSGWGQDGIGLAMALSRGGVAPFVLPLEVVPPLPRPVARRLAEPLRPPFDLLLAHVAADRSGLTSSEVIGSRTRVLWSMWEWTTFANHPDVDLIREHVRAYHAVVAYDPVSAGAFRSLGQRVPPVIEVQGGFDAAAWPAVERSWRPPVRFLMVGHLTDRKNPMAALEAFGSLLEEHGVRRFDAELHLKVIDRTNPLSWRPNRTLDHQTVDLLVPEVARPYVRHARHSRRVFVHAGTWSRRALRQLYGRMHCLVAPSRGEGKNLAALEFMATGGPVIATSFGGHAVWIREEYSYPLRYELRPASWPVPTPEAQEADIDVRHLRELLWRVYNDLGEARAKGKLAATIIPRGWDWNIAVRRLADALDEAGLGGRKLLRRPHG